MIEYWLQDARGGVLGPVRLAVLQDLATAGLLTAQTRVSVDGSSFVPVVNRPELTALFAPPPDEQRMREAQQALQVRHELQRFQALTPHELLGVSPKASWRELRQGFLELAKRYHPGRLPRDVHPDLLRARMEMFQFLSTRMALLEAEHRPSERPPPAVVTPTPTPKPPVSESLVELTRVNAERLRAVIQIPEGATGLFVQHKVVNYKTGGIFLATEAAIRLGTRLDLSLRFLLHPPREVSARGVVILEAVVASNRGPAGVGVRLDGLTDADRAFLHAYVQQAEQTQQRRF